MRVYLLGAAATLAIACNAVLGLDSVTLDSDGAGGSGTSDGNGGAFDTGGSSSNTARGGTAGGQSGGATSNGAGMGGGTTGATSGGNEPGGNGGVDDPGEGGSAGMDGVSQGGTTSGQGGTSGGSADGGTANGGTTGGTGKGGASTGGTTAGQGGTTSGGTTSKGGTTSGGTTSKGGATSGGTTSKGGATIGGATSKGGTTGAGGGGGSTGLAKFSFFVTSLEAMRMLSGSADGFGGDLRYGEATGLAGADKICTTIAEKSMPGSGTKVWRAFLSTSTVNAIDRVGVGPWYDRLGRLISQNVQGLLATRPAGDVAIMNDLPNETGVPNRAGTGTGTDDNDDVVTGTSTSGNWDGGPTCNDWTSAIGSDGPRVGHAWPANSGMSWIQAHTAPGCVPSVNLVQTGAGTGDGIGNGGGYGAIYCFALSP